MPVPDNTLALPAGSQSSLSINAAAGDLSLSQSISASASDLKRPASAASSNEESQLLSRTKTAKSHYGKAARAFLAKDLPSALLHSQHAADLLSSSSQLGSSLTASSFLSDADLDVQKLLEKVAILRLTVFTQVYTDGQISASIHDRLAQAKQQSSSDAVAIDRILLLLSKQPQSLISHLWFEALRLCTQTSADADAPSLDPTPETIHLAIELPASVISSAVLAALRLDALNPAARTGTNAARLIAEWYLASFSSAFGAASPTPKAAAAYEKIVGLYSLHVLASRLGEWEYAREFVGYSSLAESIKFDLLEQINQAQAHLTGQSDREQEAMASAQRTYAQEKAKRQQEDKQAKEAAATAASAANGGKASSKVGAKARDMATGIGSFLTANKAAEVETASSSAAGSKTSVSSRSSSRGTGGSPSGSSGSGSETGPPSHRQRSQSPTYFVPRNGAAAEVSSSSSTSPAMSPGATRSGASNASKDETRQERRSLRRSSSSRSSDYDGGNESSTSAASNHSRRSTRSNGNGAEPTAASPKEHRFKDDTGYASTRAHLSRYMEGDHRPGVGPSTPTTSSNRRKSERDLTSSNASSSSILSTITAMFDLRKANQTRTWLMSAVVMMLVFYRVARRRPSAQSAAAQTSGSRARRNAAARDARSKLVGKSGSTGGGVIGFHWLFVIWKKVMDTIRMGTQVTYL